MPANITPKRMQKAVQAGFKRLNNFRKMRLLFLEAYAGHYYDKSYGAIGGSPLNMIFNAIRVLVPNLVMNFPKHEASAKYTPYRPYAEMLELALDSQGRDMGIRDIYRRWLIDAIFLVGIVKTGLCDSGTVVSFDEDDSVDPGSIYTEVVDFDNFTMDPSARSFDTASFKGDAIKVPRYQLLDSGLYKNDIIERLPQCGSNQQNQTGQSGRLSQKNISQDEADGFHDFVEVVEVYVPRANSIVTVPRADIVVEDYLRVAEYYGPDEGRYTFLSLTQPLPNNPIPVSSVGIWYDLHIQGNKMVNKIMTQAERQKDVLGYRRASADDAQEVVDADDGDAVAMEDPKEGVAIMSFGGQARSNVEHMNQLEMWFNRISGNTEALGGLRSDAGTATQAQILQNNGQIGLEDMRDAIYAAAGRESSKRGWFLHTDPLIEIPLIKRVQVPAKMGQFGGMPQLLEPGRIEHQQVILTPEARRGDWIDFHIDIKMQSMSRMDPQIKQRNTMEFLVKGLPAVVQAAQAAAMMGIAISIPKLLIKVAVDTYGLEWFDEVFYDPEFQEQLRMQLAMSPGMEGSKGLLGGMLQNGQPGQVAKVRSQGQQQNRDQQMPAADAQSGLLNKPTY